MNMWRPVKKRALTAEVEANIRRIEAIWADCRARFGAKADGAFLFGQFGAADAMYAPVAARLHTYGVDVAKNSRSYMEAVMELPAWREWRAAAITEPWVLAEDEVDWPTVLKN
jgi:glutathione S-transferase